MLIWTVGASLLTIVAMLGAAGLVLAVREDARARLLSHLLSYAVGTLLGAAFLGLLPRALEHGEQKPILGTALSGIILFFVLEKLVLWRHCHEGHCEAHGAAGSLVLIGDALHNFVDGVVIAAAFVTALPLGVATTLAVVAHELPQELGDFAILLDSGYRPGQALALNTLSSLTTPAGAVLAYAALEQVRAAQPFFLALSAASFIYIALADLIPGLHRPEARKRGAIQVAFIGWAPGGGAASAWHEAEALMLQSGGRVADNVTRRTDLVVVGRDPGSKLNQARELGLKIGEGEVPEARGVTRRPSTGEVVDPSKRSRTAIASCGFGERPTVPARPQVSWNRRPTTLVDSGGPQRIRGLRSGAVSAVSTPGLFRESASRRRWAVAREESGSTKQGKRGESAAARHGGLTSWPR